MSPDERKYVTGIAIIGVGLGALGLFGNYCPSVTDIRSQGSDKQFVNDLRKAYVSSWALSLGLGGLVSAVDNSFLPLVAAAGAGVVMTFGYEAHLPAQHRLRSPLEIFKPVSSIETADSHPDNLLLFKTNGQLTADQNWGV